MICLELATTAAGKLVKANDRQHLRLIKRRKSLQNNILLASLPNRPFHNLEKGTGESAAHSYSLGKRKESGIRQSGNREYPLLEARLHRPANLSCFRFTCTFQELHDTSLDW